MSAERWCPSLESAYARAVVQRDRSTLGSEYWAIVLVRSMLLVCPISSDLPQPKRFCSWRLALVELVPPERPNERLGSNVQTSRVITLTSTLPSAKRTGTTRAS